MSDLQDYWSKSTAKLPDDKDPSNYALERLNLFPEHSAIVDIGGGSGEDATLFATRGHNALVMDINDVDIEKTISRAQRFGVQDQVKTIQHDLSDGKLPLESDNYDVAYSRLTLHFFLPETLASLMREIRRVLKPGGVAYLTLKSQDDIEDLNYLKSKATEVSPGIYDMNGMTRTRFTKEQLETIILSAGIPASEFLIRPYVEKLDGRNDSIKSSTKQFSLNEVVLTRPKI